MICNCLKKFANLIMSVTYLTCGALRDPETLGQRALYELFHVMAVTLSLTVDAASCFQFIWSLSWTNNQTYNNLYVYESVIINWSTEVSCIFKHCISNSVVFMFHLHVFSCSTFSFFYQWKKVIHKFPKFLSQEN